MISKLGPAIRRDIKANFSGILSFCGTMLVIQILTLLSVLVIKVETNGEVNRVLGGFSGFSLCAGIVMFVVGIAYVRENMRFLIQNGVGRTTAFLSETVTNLMYSFILAVYGEVSTYVFAFIAKEEGKIVFSDLYEMVFENTQVIGMPLAEHLKATLLVTIALFAASVAGMLISLVFFRLSKAWKIAVGVGVPVTVFIILPLAIVNFSWLRWIGEAVMSVVEFAFSAPGNAIICFAVFGIVVWLLDGLIMKRAAIMTGTVK